MLSLNDWYITWSMPRDCTSSIISFPSSNLDTFPCISATFTLLLSFSHPACAPAARGAASASEPWTHPCTFTLSRMLSTKAIA